MKKNTRLILLAVLLIAMVVFTMVMTSAATIEVGEGGDLAAAVSGAAAGDTIHVTGQVTLTDAIVVDKDLTFTGTETSLVMVGGAVGIDATSGTVTFDGLNFLRTGTTNNLNPLVRANGASAKVVIQSGNYDGVNHAIVSCHEGGTMEINGGTFLGGDSGYGVYVKGSKLHITGGTFEAYRCVTGEGAGAEIVIDGGDFYWNRRGYQDNTNMFAVLAGSSWTINDGNFTSSGIIVQANNGGNFTINGGHFTSLPAVPDGVENGDPVLDVILRISDGGMTFTINGGTFDSTNCPAPILEKNNCTALNITGGTFIHSGSQPIISGIAGKPNGKLTITGGSFTHNGAGDIIKFDATAAIEIDGVTMTHNGSGSILVVTDINTTTMKNCTLNASGIAINIQAAFTLNIENCTINAAGHGIYTDFDKGATVVIKGGSVTSTGGDSIYAADGTDFEIDDACVCTPEVNYVFSSDRFEVNGQLFGSLTQAAAAAGENGVVRLIVDVPNGFVIKADVPFILDGAGYSVGTLKISKGTVTLRNITMNIEENGANGLVLSGTGKAIVESGTYTTSSGSLIKIVSGTANVTIKGGEFSSTGGSHLIHVTVGTAAAAGYQDNPVLVVEAGTFTTASRASGKNQSGIFSESSICRIDVLGGTFIGGHAWFRMNGSGILNIGTEDPSYTLVCRDATARAIWLHNGSAGGELNVRGGEFILSKDCGADYYMNAAGAKVTISGGKFSGEISIVSMHDGDYVSPVVITGGEFLMEGKASVVNFNAAVQNDDPLKAGSLTVTGGYFKSTGFGDIFNIMADKKDAFVVISGGTFISEKSRILLCENAMTNVTITGGDFSCGGSRMFYFGTSANVVTISGGTFRFTVGPKDSKEDAIIQCLGQSECDIRIVGGTFINDRPTSEQILYNINDMCSLYVAGGFYYTVNENGFFYQDRTDASKNIPVNKDRKGEVAGVSYFSFEMINGEENAPLMMTVPTMRVNLEAQGLRFTSVVPTTVLNALRPLGGTVSYGTLIAPAEYFAELTVTDYDYIAAFEAYAAAKGLAASSVYANIPAVNGITGNDTDGYSFSASIINMKESNYNRAMTAVSYIKITKTAEDGSVTEDYLYSAVNLENAISLSKAAQNALADLSDIWQTRSGKVYCFRSVDNEQLWSRFDKTTQSSLKKYFAQ